jgi:hypothetical protein
MILKRMAVSNLQARDFGVEDRERLGVFLGRFFELVHFDADRGDPEHLGHFTHRRFRYLDLLALQARHGILGRETAGAAEDQRRKRRGDGSTRLALGLSGRVLRIRPQWVNHLGH